MTIASRNRFIRLAAVCSLVLAIAAIACVALMVARGNLPKSAEGLRPIALLDSYALTPYSPLASMIAIVMYPLLALIGLFYILFAFEKTQTVEITFFAACLFATSLEAFRVFIPFYGLEGLSNFYSVAISRVTYFSRIMTLLFLLSSSIFTTGQTSQQLGPSIFLLTFFSFSLSNAIPVNSGVMFSNYLIMPGYGAMLILIFVILGLLCTLAYLILGLTRAVREYTQAAGGIALILVGEGLLACCDSWLFLAAGSALLSWGAWVYLDRMHRYYLWQ